MTAASCIEFDLAKITIENGSTPSGAMDDIVVDVEFEVLQDQLQGAVDLKLIFIPSKGEDAIVLLPDHKSGARSGMVMPGEQILDEVEAAPLHPKGKRKLQLIGEAPNLFDIKKENQLDVGAVVVSASYRGCEFYRLGWYLYHEYEDEELKENPPPKLEIEKVKRFIDSENPLETNFAIEWGNTGVKFAGEDDSNSDEDDGPDAKRARFN